MKRQADTATPRDLVRTIVSGGQTGADRAGLDAAIELGIAHGGWVPRGRFAEDGRIDVRYQLRETPSPELRVRTEWNVRDADATLIVSHGPLRGGSALTRRLARQLQKPVLHLDLNRLDPAAAVDRLRAWLTRVRPSVLNVAGSRASNDPLIYECVRQLLRRLFTARRLRGM